jgi:hypothetical protein
MSSLAERIVLLEGMLKDFGAEPPPAEPFTNTKAEAAAKQSAKAREPTSSSTTKSSAARKNSQSTAQPPPQQGQNQNPENTTRQVQDTSPQDNGNRTTLQMFSMEKAVNGHSPDSTGSLRTRASTEGSSPRRIHDSKNESIVDKFLSTRGHMTFDQLSGCLRFFGPTTNYHIYAAHENAFVDVQSHKQTRRTEKIIQSLTPATHDYLMNLFWDYYNTTLHVVHKEAFNTDRENMGTKYYSGFLHICMLAIGYRFADTTREDMAKITVGQRESFLHREAKYMLDVELERPGGLPSVQAFLLLGDLECGVGRDNTGWMFAGMWDYRKEMI